MTGKQMKSHFNPLSWELYGEPVQPWWRTTNWQRYLYSGSQYDQWQGYSIIVFDAFVNTFVKKNLVICACVWNGQQTGNAICNLALNMINDKVPMESFNDQLSINLWRRSFMPNFILFQVFAFCWYLHMVLIVASIHRWDKNIENIKNIHLKTGDSILNLCYILTTIFAFNRVTIAS